MIVPMRHSLPTLSPAGQSRGYIQVRLGGVPKGGLLGAGRVMEPLAAQASQRKPRGREATVLGLGL